MKVLVGFSGGVDSTAAILLLKERGYSPVAVTFIFNEFFEAQKTDEIARKIGVPIVKIDLRDEFERAIIKKFIEEYKSGRTPNVCGLCNRDFKIRRLAMLMEELGADLIATGHYARILEIKGKKFIARARDKDQSYFLALVRKEDLEKLVLPLGDVTKEWVRQYVEAHGVKIARDEESQDVCFVRGKFREFMETRVGVKPGQIIGPDGEVVGIHNGIQYYTVGQRRGLEVALGRRVYVGRIEPGTNRVYLQEKDEIYRKFMIVEDLNWFNGPAEGEFLVQIRNVHRAAPARVKLVDSEVLVEFDEPQWAPTPGQIAAFYRDDVLVGGGIIKSSYN